jgi:hypothetical protein
LEVVNIARTLGAKRFKSAAELATTHCALHVLARVGGFLRFWRNEVSGKPGSRAECVRLVLLNVTLTLCILGGLESGVERIVKQVEGVLLELIEDESLEIIAFVGGE